MVDAYRVPSGEPIARLEGASVVVPLGLPLPRLCVLCGGQKKLNDRAMSLQEASGGFVVGPIWLVAAAVLLRAVHNELERKVVPPGPLEYSCCTPCELRARDARQLGSGLWVGAGVGALGAATAGFNGAPFLGVGILLATSAGVWFAYRRFIRGRSFSVRLQGKEVVLTGVHGDAVQSLLVSRLAPTDADVPVGA